MKPSPGNGVPSLSLSASGSSSSLRTPMGDRKRLIDELINSMKLLMSDDDSGGLTPPIVENGPHVDRFCLVIEFILLFGFKDKSKGLFSGQPRDYWNFIENLKTLHPPSKPSLERIGNSTKLKSLRARGRAWIRLALVESNLEANLRRLTNSNSLIQ
jgi:hypothetical protein